MMSVEIGKVLGTEDAQPLDFWIAVAPEQVVQLDDVIFLNRELPDGRRVSLYGVVDILRARHEGAHFETDVFLSEQGIFPLGRSIVGHVSVTRVEPEIFVPPLPGQAVFRAAGRTATRAFLRFDGAQVSDGTLKGRRSRVRESRFLDGSRGAHINISESREWRPKTYAIPALRLFHSGILEEDATMRGRSSSTSKVKTCSSWTSRTRCEAGDR